MCESSPHTLCAEYFIYLGVRNYKQGRRIWIYYHTYMVPIYRVVQLFVIWALCEWSGQLMIYLVGGQECCNSRS